MPINTGTAPIEGAESLAVRIESELSEIVRHVTYSRRKPFSSGGRQPQPNAQALDSRVVVSCYNHGERQELIVQLNDGVQPRVAAERINAALKQWFPSTEDAPATTGPSNIPPLPVSSGRPDGPPAAAVSPPPPATASTTDDPLADHADFFEAHADLVEVMQRHPLPVIEEVWLRLQAISELGWEVAIEDGRPTFRRKRQ
jgi:hypothetical protein